jgi:hypothetical protein
MDERTATTIRILEKMLAGEGRNPLPFSERYAVLNALETIRELDATAAPVEVGEDQIELMTCAAYDAWIDAVQSDEPPTNFGAIQIAIRAALTAALAGD